MRIGRAVCARGTERYCTTAQGGMAPIQRVTELLPSPSSVPVGYASLSARPITVADGFGIAREPGRTYVHCMATQVKAIQHDTTQVPPHSHGFPPSSLSCPPRPIPPREKNAAAGSAPVEATSAQHFAGDKVRLERCPRPATRWRHFPSHEKLDGGCLVKGIWCMPQGVTAK